MRVETWTSDKGGEEIHHFVEGTQTYLFGFNEDLLGKSCYLEVRSLVLARLQQLEHAKRDQ